MNRLNTFRSAAESADRLLLTHPNSIALKSVLDQLRYLVDVESGASSDLSRLSFINIGLLAAKEVEDMDEDVAVMLYGVSAEVKAMLRT